jgi:hypothetical protein
MPISEQLKSLVAQMPAADERGMYTSNMDKEKIEKTAAALAKDGKANMLGLIELLGEPGSEENVKPHYALHCLVNQSLVEKNDGLRKELCAAMATQLQNKQLHPVNRAYLCQELQWAAPEESCEALGEVLSDEEVSDAAATALMAIGGEQAAKQLRDAFQKAEGKAKLNLMDALASLEDAKSADLFRQSLRDKNREVRLAAAQGLASLGLPDASAVLLEIADAAEGWERVQLTKACLVQAETLAAAGKKKEATNVYESLKKSRTSEKEQYLQEAVRRGMTAIA